MSTGNTMKKLLLATLISICAIPAFAQNAKSVRFGVDPTFAPFESVDPQGKLVGLDIELGNALCKKMNVTCEWVKIDFDGAIPALKAKKIDGILSSMSVNEKRKKEVLFSTELYNSASRMMLPKDKSLEPTVESLKGKKIGVVQGTTQAAFAKKHWQGKGVNLVMYQNDERARQDLALGRVDATLQDEASAQSFFESAEGAKFHVSGKPADDISTLGSGTAIGLNLGDKVLQAKINTAFKELRTSGAYDEMLKPYLKFGVIPPK
jgi:lysine-arginine-ornithine-binding protein